MNKLFKIAMFIQVSLLTLYMILVIATLDRGVYLEVFAFSLLVVGVFIFAITAPYTENNKLFKTIDELNSERKKYKKLSRLYIEKMKEEVERL